MATTNIRYLQVATFSLFINLLPAAIHYHLQTCYVYGVLVTIAMHIHTNFHGH